MHFKYAPGAYLLYSTGALCIQICSWSIFDLEYYYRLFMLLEHNLGLKSHKNMVPHIAFLFSSFFVQKNIIFVQ